MQSGKATAVRCRFQESIGRAWRVFVFNSDHRLNANVCRQGYVRIGDTTALRVTILQGPQPVPRHGILPGQTNSVEQQEVAGSTGVRAAQLRSRRPLCSPGRSCFCQIRQQCGLPCRRQFLLRWWRLRCGFLCFVDRRPPLLRGGDDCGPTSPAQFPFGFGRGTHTATATGVADGGGCSDPPGGGIHDRGFGRFPRPSSSPSRHFLASSICESFAFSCSRILETSIRSILPKLCDSRCWPLPSRDTPEQIVKLAGNTHSCGGRKRWIWRTALSKKFDVHDGLFQLLLNALQRPRIP